MGYKGLLTNLLLILVWPLNIDDTKLELQLAKALTPQSLGEDVRQLLLGSDGLELHPVLLHAFTNKMVTNIDMPTTIMENGILAERDGGLVVNLQCDSVGFLVLEFSK